MLNNEKEHYKMYKSGKMWVYSSVVIATLLGGATTVSADTSSNATSNVSSASNASSTATQASTTTSLNSKTTNKAEINAKDTTLVAGPNTKWTAEDNFVSATDQTGKDVSFTNIAVEGSVDTNKAGQYAITYKFTDVDGTVVSKTIRVTVENSKLKVETKNSTLIAGPNTKWVAGDNFVSATDQNGSSIELKDVQVSGSVDTTKAGKYSVTYSYQDASGNTVSQIATVTVVNDETSKNVDIKRKNINMALQSNTPVEEVSGVNVTTSFQNGDTFSNGTGTIALNVVIDNTATIKKGSVLSFKISNPDAINWNNIQLNGGTNYGSLTYDQQSGTIKYTFNVDVTNGNINFIVNLHPTASDINNTTITSDVDGVLVPISGGTSFNNKKSSDNGGGTYNEQRLIIGNGSYGYSGTPDNYVGYINGKTYYLPNQQSMNFNIVLDPGFYTEKENDKSGRKIQLTISGTNASIDLDSLYITEKGGYPNTSQSYVSLKSMGWIFKQISPTSVEIDIPDGFSMGWYLLGIVPKTPDLDSEYKLTANYSSDAVTTVQTTSITGYFQNISNKGFVPQITAEDKTINRSSNISNLSDWLLNNVSASDVEDGNLDNNITITDDQGFLDAWNKNENGSYKVTYSVTDKDGNTTTKTINVTIYSNITIHYVDQDGKTIQSDTTQIANANGETYNIIPLTKITKDNSVYNYVSASSSLTGTYGSNNQPTDITLTYQASKTTIDAKDSTLVAGPNTKWTAGDNFVSATDQAGNPVELKDITVTGAPDPTKAGQYDVTYSYTDASGNTVSKTITVTVVDSKASIDAKDSTLVAGPNTKWTAGDNFVSATDQAGNPVELKDIKVAGAPDPTKAGQYEITYSYTDASGNTVSKTITVTVVDSKASIDAKDSTLVAGPNTKWTAGDNFVSATDQAGNPVELKDITVTGAPDPTKAGQYDVTYSYTDASGNTVSKTITVTVVDSKASIDAKDSTLVAGPNTKWTAGDNFVSATDQAGNPIELKNITVKGSVDTNKAGQYEITYSYTDASGNTVSKTITVTVLAPSSDSGSNSSNSKTPDSPTVKVSYRLTKNNDSGNKQLPDTGENIDGLIGSLVSAIFAASLGILTIVSKKKNDN